MSEVMDHDAIDRAYRILSVFAHAEHRRRNERSHADLQRGIDETMTRWWNGEAI